MEIHPRAAAGIAPAAADANHKLRMVAKNNKKEKTNRKVRFFFAMTTVICFNKMAALTTVIYKSTQYNYLLHP